MLAAPGFDNGVELYRQRQFGAAEKQFAHILVRDPKNAQARFYRARALVELDRVPEALEEVKRALAAPGAGPETQFQAGRLMRELAEKRLAQLERAAPGSPALHELAGASFERSGDLAAALKEYRAAAALEPKRPGVHYRMGNVAWRMRDLAAAAENLKAELASTPHHGMANLRMGQILVVENREAEALSYLQRAAAAMPESIDAHRELGKAYAKTGDAQAARREWELVATARPDDSQIHYLLGNLYRSVGENELAKRELEKHRALLERRRVAAGQR